MIGPLKIQFGCGGLTIDGWVNTDLEPVHHRNIIKIDITQPLPFSTNTVDYMLAEHLIEHVKYSDARLFLTEAHRCLRPGGVIRLITPSLDKLVSLCTLDPDTALPKDYELSMAFIDEMSDPVPYDAYRSPCAYTLLNRYMRDWGHDKGYLYTEDQLTHQLVSAGFQRIFRPKYNKSNYLELNGIDQHHKIHKWAEFESLVMEGAKS